MNHSALVPYRRYLRLLLLACALFSGAAVLLNALVDPLDIYRLVVRRGFNADKSEYQPYARVAKPVQMEWQGYERYAFGASRVDLAVPMEYGQWAKDYPRGFNAALNASNLQTILDMLQHAAAVGDVKDVLIAVDLYMFNGLNQAPYLYPDMLATFNPDPWKRHFQQASTTLFSPSITSASIATWRHQKPGRLKRKPTGQAWMPWEIESARRNGYESMFRRYEDGLVRRVWTPCSNNHFAYHYPGGEYDTLAIFQQILDLSRSKGFRLTLFIEPVHARLLDTMNAAGMWDTNEQWKRDITRMIEATQAAHPGAPITLWDFSGYNAYSTEAVPTDPQATMRWYIDSSHYTEELAKIMLDVMYGGRTDFGARLDSTTIEGQLARLRAERDAWHAAHAADYAGLVSRAEAILAEKSRNGVSCP